MAEHPAKCGHSSLTVNVDDAEPLLTAAVPRHVGDWAANARHFVPNPRVVLAQLLTWLRPGGRVVLVEYEGRRPSRWVPYPISAERLPEIVAGLGLSTPKITASRPSAYGGSLYVAVTQRDS